MTKKINAHYEWIEDIGENAGGIYVMIYADDEHLEEIDNMAVSKEEIETAGGEEAAIIARLEA